MNKITFCINTAKNERPYVEILLQSLLNGIDINLHHILIFVDSDNQGTTEMLSDQHSLFPNLKIIKNNGPPIGYQKNINYMFQKAETEIVSYIQSDQIVCLAYDEAVLSHLTENRIISSTRVEPPLHAQYDNNITYVRNFGLTPDEFKYEEFLRFAESVKNPSKVSHYFFAPFTLYKKTWNQIGGHDCSFKYSREDSDIALRFCLDKVELKQSWQALVYHFTCTSSRGIEWWKPENQEAELKRQANDRFELDRFIKKWGQFMHPSSYHDIQQYIKLNPSALNKIKVVNPTIDETNFEIL